MPPQLKVRLGQFGDPEIETASASTRWLSGCDLCATYGSLEGRLPLSSFTAKTCKPGTYAFNCLLAWRLASAMCASSALPPLGPAQRSAARPRAPVQGDRPGSTARRFIIFLRSDTRHHRGGRRLLLQRCFRSRPRPRLACGSCTAWEWTTPHVPVPDVTSAPRSGDYEAGAA
jgi:hypothetical protein